MNESEALKRFIPILGRISTPGERATITRNILERIAGKQTSIMGVSHKHAGSLAWPNDTVKATAFELALNDAVDTGEFVSILHPADCRHFQIEELSAWPECPAISPDSPLIFWLGEPETAPAIDTEKPAPQESIDYAMLAQPDQLIEAFGRFTGMDTAWFDKWADYPVLRDAIKVKGTSGRGRTTEPLFCPFLVMQGLMKKPRKGSNRKAFLTVEKPWELLKRYFPKVYATHQGLSPLDD